MASSRIVDVEKCGGPRVDTADPSQVLAPGRADLERMRSDFAHWAVVSYAETDAADGYPVDGNAVRRASVLWAAQYDRREDDKDLLRHLLEQETLHHRTAQVQGISDELRLAVYLVARWQESADLRRLYEARFANFDTWFALSGLPLGDLSRSGREPVWDAEGIRRWVKEVGDVAFPGHVEEETQAEWVRRARMQGMYSQARAFLVQGLEHGSPDTGALRHIQHELARIGEYAEAVRVQRMLVGRESHRAFGSGASLCRLSELETLAGETEEAWRSLRRSVASLDNDEALGRAPSPWRSLGIGVHVAQQHMRIVLAAAEEFPGLAHEVFTAGTAILEELKTPTRPLLSLTRNAALSLNLRTQAERYAEWVGES